MKRPSPPANSNAGFECRVRFSGKLLGAALVSKTEPPPKPPARSVPVAPPSPPAPAPLADPAAKTSPAQPAPVPADFWKTDLARELKTDRARIEEVLRHIETASQELKKDQAERLSQWQKVAIELAMTIATRLLHERVASGDFPIEAKVRDMVAQLESEPAVAVRLNPADLQLLQTRLGSEPLFGGPAEPRLIPDETLARGDCRVEGKEAMLVSEVGRELVEIREELLRSIAHARS